MFLLYDITRNFGPRGHVLTRIPHWISLIAVDFGGYEMIGRAALLEARISRLFGKIAQLRSQKTSENQGARETLRKSWRVLRKSQGALAAIQSKCSHHRSDTVHAGQGCLATECLDCGKYFS